MFVIFFGTLYQKQKNTKDMEKIQKNSAINVDKSEIRVSEDWRRWWWEVEEAVEEVLHIFLLSILFLFKN
jgi:2-polyprenyl-3-methyl-5-hydroxy-6-metoxy-1,4-benzoquinol methylase